MRIPNLTPRFLALALRGSSMGSVFLTGLIVTATRPDQVLSYFTCVAAVPLIVAASGMELHTETDRQVARGMAPPVALRWLLHRTMPVAAVIACAVVLCADLIRINEATAIALGASSITGVVAQEVFRISVALGRNVLANALTMVRVFAPNALSIALWGIDSFTVADFLWIQSLSNVIAASAPFFVRALGANEAQPVPSDKLRPLHAVSHFLPVAIAARALLSVDVILLARFDDVMLSGLYGNINAALLAILTATDVAVVQWRFRAAMRAPSQSARRLQFELAAAAAAGTVAVGGFAAILVRQTGVPLADVSTLLPLTFLVASTAFAVLSQGEHLLLYSMRRDASLAAAYIGAAVVFLSLLFFGLATRQFWLFASAKLIAWAILYASLHFMRKGSA